MPSLARPNELVAELLRAGELVEQRVSPEASFGGWSGRDVLVHLAAYTRLVAAFLRGAAEQRVPGHAELFGRELSEAELAMNDLDQINHAVIREHAHLSYGEARALWRSMHQEAVVQLGRLSDEQLAAPGPDYMPAWRSPHLGDVVARLGAHYEAHLSGQPH
jgi:DinB superfamily